MIFGVNCDPRHWPASEYDALAAEIAATGATWVRTVLIPYAEGRDDEAWFAACHRAGLSTLGVIARESWSWGDPPTERSISQGMDALHQYYEVYPTAWQCCNESDQVGPSSWTMIPSVLNLFLSEFRRVFGMVLLVGPGLASGQPYHYARRLIDIDARHPYVPAEGYWGFRRMAGKPIWITEYPANEEGLLERIAEVGGVDVCFAFCWSQRMVPGYGLVDIDGQPIEPRFSEFRAVASASAQSPSGATERPANDSEVQMKLEDVAPNYGGFDSPPVVIGGTQKKPTARIAWVAGVENGYILEINGQASTEVYVPRPK